MENELKKTINLVEKINIYLKNENKEFDKEYILDVFTNSRKKLEELLHQLENLNLDEKEKLNELIVYTELKYANLIWSFNRIRDALRNIIIKL